MAVYMLSENNLALKEIQTSIVSADKKLTTQQIQSMLVSQIKALGFTPDTASDEIYYKACAMVVRSILKEKRRYFMADAKAKGRKQTYYMCMEFLLGRSLKNGIYNLHLAGEFSQALKEMGVRMENLFELEPDAGLGNGGLGRLAACFMDALATCGYPAMGYSILYEFGIFKQKIIDGWQTELPDEWLPGGEVWLERIPEHAVDVNFGGHIEEFWDYGYHHVLHKDYTTVKAVPYDIMISGYDGKGVSVLRVWSAQSSAIDMDAFNRGDYIKAFGQDSTAEAISKILYPNDNHPAGKNLRLRQQYFLVAASISDIVRRHMELYGTLENFAEKNAIHINDTHPALAIPELMRILLDECGYPWDQAWKIVSDTFAYTNHTVMPEALESWNEDMFRTLLPRIYQIIVEINNRFCRQLTEQFHLDGYTVSRMAIINGHSLHMANLAVVASHSVNGVSNLHSNILRESLFHDFYKIWPNKFQNVTNGIASRRWLYQTNPQLNNYIRELIGDGFMHDMTQLKKLLPYQNDKQVLEQLAKIKLENKRSFAEYIQEHTGQVIDPNSLFDVQVKRLHEYKRQHLNALHILSLYNEIKSNPHADIQPTTFIFGAKAAPGYYMAKQIIKFICSLGKMIENDPQTRDILKVVYLEDYRVTLSELLMPASEVSEQISLAGTEASGTGNMKLMLNGAVTLGTWDGANVEIGQSVGEDNIFVFGMRTPEVQQLKKSGYYPSELYLSDPVLKQAIDMIGKDIAGDRFDQIATSLKTNDPYMVLRDFESYDQTKKRLLSTYQHDPMKWQKMSLNNIAQSGYFCADRAIQEYAHNIWNLD